MRTLRMGISLTAVFILLVCPATAADHGKQHRELEWVKRLTAEFFELALAVESERDYSTPATVFLSAELNARLKDKRPESTLAKMAWQYRGGTFRLKSAEMAPNGSEVVLQGERVPGAQRADSAKAREEAELAPNGIPDVLGILWGVTLARRASEGGRHPLARASG